MLYFILQSGLLLGATALVFFGMGYFFHRQFARARVVVSDQPPLEPPKSKHNEEADKIIRDLRTRLLERERDLAQLLESVPETKAGDELSKAEQVTQRLQVELNDLQRSYQEVVTRKNEAEQRCDRLEGELRELRESNVQQASDHIAELALKAAQAEGLQIELDKARADLLTGTLDTQWKEEAERLRTEVAQKSADLAQKDAELSAKGHLLVQREADLELLRQELDDRGAVTTVASLSDSEVNELREELQRKVDEIAALQGKVETLESQLYEREYLLQMARSQKEREREDLVRAVDAIWEDDMSILQPEDVEDEIQISAQVSDKVQELQARHDAMEREFREKILKMESTIKDLRSDNEMALMTALELEKAPPPPSAPDHERDSLVEALWRTEQDSEKEKLRKSVDVLRRELEAKEHALEMMGSQIENLSQKVDPKLQGPDDLQLIKGIGPFIRKMLEREFGIRSFEELAKMDRRKFEGISGKLFFKNQIERDDWIRQAKELHEKKYGHELEVNDPPYPTK